MARIKHNEFWALVVPLGRCFQSLRGMIWRLTWRISSICSCWGVWAAIPTWWCCRIGDSAQWAGQAAKCCPYQIYQSSRLQNSWTSSALAVLGYLTAAPHTDRDRWTSRKYPSICLWWLPSSSWAGPLYSLSFLAFLAAPWYFASIISVFSCSTGWFA